MTARPVKNKKSQEKERPVKRVGLTKKRTTNIKREKPTIINDLEAAESKNLIIVKDENGEKSISNKLSETSEEKRKRMEEEYKDSVNYILSISNEKLNNVSYKWKVIIIIVLIAGLILITFLRLRGLADGFKQSANTVTDVQDNVKGYAADPNKTANELITQIRNAVATTKSQNAANDTAKTVDAFDLANSTFIIEGRNVKLASGTGSFDNKPVVLEKMMYKGDFNNDNKDDIACVLSIKDNDSVSWYLAAIIDGEKRTVVPAVKIVTNYPIVTGIMGGEKNDEVFIAETAWKEQQTKIKTYTITKEGIKGK